MGLFDAIADQMIVLGGCMDGPIGGAIQDAGFDISLRNYEGSKGGNKMAIKTVKADGNFADYVRGLNYKNIGPNVSAGTISDNLLSDITAVCRRAFRKTDVIVYVDLDDEEDFEEGMAFTKEAVFYWCNSGSSITKILYADIEKVDFDDTDIIIDHEGASTRITLGEDAEEERYPRSMYNFLMDILEYDETEYLEKKPTEDEGEDSMSNFGICKKVTC